MLVRGLVRGLVRRQRIKNSLPALFRSYVEEASEETQPGQRPSRFDNTRLKKFSRPADVFATFLRHRDEMDIVNKVTALTHISKLRSRDPDAFNDPAYFELVSDVQAGMFVGGRVMSTAFNTLLRLRKVDEDLLQKIATYSLEHVEEMSLRDLATIIHCFGIAGYRFDPVLHAISEHLISQTSSLSATDVAFLFWGFAQLRYRHDALLDSLVKCVDKDMGSYGPGGLATIAWSIAVLQRSDRELLNAILLRVLPCLDMIKWGDTCLLLWACAAVQLEDKGAVTRVAEYLDAKQLPLTQTVTVLWSAVALGLPWERQSRTLMPWLARRADEISALDYSYLIWAYGQQQCYQQTFAKAMADRGLALLPKMAVSHIVNTIFGFTQLRYFDEELFDALFDRFAQCQWTDLSTSQLIMVLRGQTTLNYEYDLIFESLISELLARKETLDAVQLTEVAFALCLFNQFANGTRWMRVMHKLSTYPPEAFSTEAAHKMAMLLKTPELMRFGPNFSANHLIRFAAEWSQYKDTIASSSLANEVREALTVRSQQFGTFEANSDVDLLVRSPPDESNQSAVTLVLLQPVQSFSQDSSQRLLGLPTVRARMLQATYPNLVVINPQSWSLWSNARDADRTLMMRKLFKTNADTRFDGANAAGFRPFW
eukprot:GILK01008084.1.p1 GENE.GILK01008084.1~~GILK01008084.1.p1  ORF type:complete len:654 (+),score=50.35 GILK01008084.1:1-1962(+)